MAKHNGDKKCPIEICGTESRETTLLKKLIMQMVSYTPEDRPSIDEVLYELEVIGGMAVIHYLFIWRESLECINKLHFVIPTFYFNEKILEKSPFSNGQLYPYQNSNAVVSFKTILLPFKQIYKPNPSSMLFIYLVHEGPTIELYIC